MPYLPFYNVHPCIMHIPILKPVSRKKVSMSFLTTTNFLEKDSAAISNLAPPAWNSIARVDANYLMFCLFGDSLSFMMFSSFSSAVLLLHDQTWFILAMSNIFWSRRPGIRLDDHVIRFKMADNLSTTCVLWKYFHDLLSFKCFCICAKHQKIN